MCFSAGYRNPGAGKAAVKQGAGYGAYGTYGKVPSKINDVTSGTLNYELYSVCFF